MFGGLDSRVFLTSVPESRSGDARLPALQVWRATQRALQQLPTGRDHQLARPQQLPGGADLSGPHAIQHRELPAGHKASTCAGLRSRAAQALGSETWTRWHGRHGNVALSVLVVQLRWSIGHKTKIMELESQTGPKVGPGTYPLPVAWISVAFRSSCGGEGLVEKLRMLVASSAALTRGAIRTGAAARRIDSRRRPERMVLRFGMVRGSGGHSSTGLRVDIQGQRCSELRRDVP